METLSPFITDWVFANAERRPTAAAVSTPTASLDYRSVADRVRALAAHLGAEGVRSGERVVVALPNTPATVIASLAVQFLGATPVEANREWATEVLAGIARQTGARHAFVWGRDAKKWRECCVRQPLERLWVVHPEPLPGPLAAAMGPTRTTLVLDDGRVDPRLGAASPPLSQQLERDAPAVILYTSGSTGRPRGVVQTHRNLDANTRSIVEYLHLTPDDRALLILPLYYCYGRSVLQTHLFAGGSVFLDGRFAFPRVVLEALGTQDCTGFAGVPLTFEIIRRQVDVSTLSFPRLRYVTQAGGAMGPATIDWARAAFAPAKLFVMYGQTEATARLSYLPPDRAEEKRGSIGIPIPGVELSVVDEAGRELPPGETGHLVARGGNVTQGYLDEPEETATILRDGRLWTGDLARRDRDGFFYLQGRSKEILKIGGHRVSPTQIEHVVAEHPDVAESAVIGVAHPLLGEAPVAFVVPRAGRSPGETDLRSFCGARLPSYQVPIRFSLVEALPRNDAGKLLRTELASRALQTAPDRR